MSDSSSQQGSSSRRYHLLTALGSGGFGSVFRARLEGASGFSKAVAIKVLNEDIADQEEFKRRLRDEARMLAALNHRAIVRVEDLVLLDGRWAVVMEFIEGADLKELMSLGPIPLRPACEIIAEAASALRVAHEACDPSSGERMNIVHRDIKPANIRITGSGEVKILDFGVARADFSSREAITRSVAFWSEGYAAPERFDGIDSPASDVFSLGVVAWECLTGKRMGRLSVNPKAHNTKVMEQLELLGSALHESTRRPILTILHSMMAYDPAGRPPTNEVAETFQDLVPHAEGTWLNRWAFIVVPRVQQAEVAVTPVGVETVPSISDALPAVQVEKAGSSRQRPDTQIMGTGQQDTLAAIQCAVQQRDGPPPVHTSLQVPPGMRTGPEASNPHAYPAVQPASTETGHTTPCSTSPPQENSPLPQADEPSHPAHIIALNQSWARRPLTVGADDGLGRRISVALPNPSSPEPVNPWPRRVLLAVLLCSLGVFTLTIRGLRHDAGRIEADVAEPEHQPVSEPEPAPSLAWSSSELATSGEEPAGTAPPAQTEHGATTAAAVTSYRTPARQLSDATSATVGTATPRTSLPLFPPELGTGQVAIRGDHREAWLIDTNGRKWPPGKLPAGTYDLEAIFPSGRQIHLKVLLKVQQGGSATIICSAAAENCRL